MPVTAEDVFKYYRGYKFYCLGRCRLEDGKPIIKPAPPLITQKDRRFYHRLSQKLTDPQIHSLFLYEFFFNPDAHVSTMATPDAFRRGLLFNGRGENGRTLIENDLYELKKSLSTEEDVQEFLYGIRDGEQGIMPGCLQAVIARELPIDLACMLLMHPVPELELDWAAYWKAQPDLGLGARSWVTRLERLHVLLKASRRLWKTSQPAELAASFWHSLDLPLTPQITPKEPSLF